MRWKGLVFGAWLGSLFGGPLGALFGAALGHTVEKQLAAGEEKAAGHGGPTPQQRSMLFCASAAAMLAKMAKADGHVSQTEIAAVEQAFARLGFSPAARAYAVSVFRKAKDDQHTIYDYADEFAAAINSVGVRELFYEILWDVARADGDISTNELTILRFIPRHLRIRPEWYGYFASERPRARATPDPLQSAYLVLGATADDSDEDVKRKYRDLAKRNHPDALRAQGLPEEMIGKATEKMSRINDAWKTVREARGL